MISLQSTKKSTIITKQWVRQSEKFKIQRNENIWWQKHTAAVLLLRSLEYYLIQCLMVYTSSLRLVSLRLANIGMANLSQSGGQGAFTPSDTI